jgi:hypothetical protein
MNATAELIPMLKILPYHDGVEIVGNREGLQDLAEICLALSRLSLEEAKTAANHYHFADYMNSAEDGSVPLIVRFQPDL